MATGTVINRSFYARDTLTVAKELLGKVLVHGSREGETSGAIVEVEAYVGESDPACHASHGYTTRNAPLYGQAGQAYVYLNYGVHHLLNAVTESEGFPAAVLIRAVEPIGGLSLMAQRRKGSGASTVLGEVERAALCRGPGNLSRAFGITLVQNRLDLTASRLLIVDQGRSVGPIKWTGRVGIREGTDRTWRCFAAANACVSRPSF